MNSQRWVAACGQGGSAPTADAAQNAWQAHEAEHGCRAAKDSLAWSCDICRAHVVAATAEEAAQYRTDHELICGPMRGIGRDGRPMLPAGPALVFISDDGTVYHLDRLPTAGDPAAVDDRMPLRDRNVLRALWQTFSHGQDMLGRW